MDQTDLKILEELQANGRMTMTELGKKVALTAPAAAERVRKLEERGIIQQYSVVINPEKVNKPISAFILFDTERCEQFVEFCKNHPEVVECNRLAGQYSYLVKIVTSSVSQLELFINNTMKYGKSTTLIVLSSPIQSGPIRFGDEGSSISF
ncbi:Lrp/AsnC family transcriptional regulator [Neobacillus sp. D3-1R]|uniref:Lrp/AsnC family transcriptional regulator n=1 Tax=Neobacillus sp. D3-1R TaxID=3445778 RepID=UPI003FA192AB